MKNQKPELLLPAGNVEAFFAAVAGGADAVYLGLKQFNARGRASNFSPAELAGIISFARSKKIKVYVTLNTLIKNRDISGFLDQLQLLKNLKPDAVIIQDWGAFYLIKKYFQGLALHASTQMAVHNSCGANHALFHGFSRVILAREITRSEIAAMAKKTEMPLEVFVHGALCYSFSGMCLFSSFIGGNSANRGNCMQVCRRDFDAGIAPDLPFNLKDNQLIQFLGELSVLNIASLKIEGRLKQAEYVYKTAQAYRLALDAPAQTDKAAAILETDGGREKTAWFFGNDVSRSLSDNNQTGLLAGSVSKITADGFEFKTELKLKNESRLRLNSASTREPVYCKPSQISGNTVSVKIAQHQVALGDEVYVTSSDGLRFNDRLPKVNLPEAWAAKNIKIGAQNLYRNDGVSAKEGYELYARVSGFNALNNIDASKLVAVFVPIANADTGNARAIAETCGSLRHKLFFEFPKFISESRLNDYSSFAKYMVEAGFNNFVVNHLSQRMMLPRNAKFIAGENVHVLNDMAALMIKSEGAMRFTYSVENDYPNLITGKSRDGIVPLYFYPDLFFSRMPVRIEPAKPFTMKGEKTRFIKTVADGITTVRPEKPVSLLHMREKLEAKGFSRFLIDCSQAATPEEMNAIMKAFINKEKIEGSTLFNFKMELK